MRVAFFGTAGSITLRPIERMAVEHEVVLFVRPGPSPRLVRRLAEVLRLRQPTPLDVFTRRARIPTAWMPGPHDERIAGRLEKAAPDVILISSFRWLLPSQVLATAGRGAFNLHSSLLPRHRGPVPLFWIFRENDRETGVTVHRVSERADAGEIIVSDRWSLERGSTADQLNETNGIRGADLLSRMMRDLERGQLRSFPQDESLATKAPAVPRSGHHVLFDEWPAERVWHFLHAVYPYYVEELADGDGKPVRYSAVVGWQAGAVGRPGIVTRQGDGLILHCVDGVVRLRGRASP